MELIYCSSGSDFGKVLVPAPVSDPNSEFVTLPFKIFFHFMLDTDSNTTPERIRNQNESGPGSVADPGCLSRIPIFTHPESRIKKKRDEKN